SSHKTEIFAIGQPRKDTYALIPSPPGVNRIVVLLLLEEPPISQTLQLQYHVYTQQPNTYFAVHNLVIYFWGESEDNLKAKQLSISYFPDKSDKEIIHAL